jgi:DNA ligase (NAD+)
MAVDKATFDNKLKAIKDAYYNGHPIMTDLEYDKLIAKYKELFGEEESVGAPVPSKVDEIKRVKHKFPAKSLDKTKDIDKFVTTFDVSHNQQDLVVLMWKLDGSTIQLTYYNGKLVNAATRGDGVVGQDITHNAPYINGIPLEIKEKGFVTVRGEATMSYSNFEKLNASLPDEDKYENPRNLANATITMKDPNEMKKRDIDFNAFEVVYHPNMNGMSFSDRMLWCLNSGFGVVEFETCSVSELKDLMNKWSARVEKYNVPVDGLVCALENAPYADTLKGTEHHPHQLHGFAFKWADEEKETVLREILWQPSRTGLLNPVAIFDPVRLEGTTVERASLHNFSIMRNLHIRIGDKITVYKANKIIPQVAENLSDNTSPYDDNDVQALIGVCPKCGSKGVLHVSDNGIETVYCDNPNCGAKFLDKLVHFCSRGCMDIAGLSEATLSKFVDLGWINYYTDIYELNKHEEEIKSMEGFGEKSYDNLWKSIQKSRTTSFVPFVTALGIPGIGTGQAKLLAKHFNDDIVQLMDGKNATYDFTVIDGFGEVLSSKLQTWIKDNIVNTTPNVPLFDLMEHLEFEWPDNTSETSSVLEGKTFVVTGKVTQFDNRDAIHKFIEDNGGKTSGSVTSKTSYLVNNDVESTSGKNKKAKELNIPIISEEQLINMVKGEE